MKKNNTPVPYSTIYTGTIVKRCINGEDIIYKENASLIQNSKVGEYLWYDNIITQVVEFTNKLLEDNDYDKNLANIIEKHVLTTEIPNIDGTLFIDASSLREKKDGKSRR